MKQHDFFLTMTIFLLNACSNESNHTEPEEAVYPPPVKANLPISADKWTTWYCPNGNTIKTRYSTPDADELQLEINNTVHRLRHEPGINPAIYSSNTLAFYSDGQFATIGRPLSDEIYSGGCVIR